MKLCEKTENQEFVERILVPVLKAGADILCVEKNHQIAGIFALSAHMHRCTHTNVYLLTCLPINLLLMDLCLFLFSLLSQIYANIYITRRQFHRLICTAGVLYQNPKIAVHDPSNSQFKLSTILGR